uniref:Uncharacterized protein n=1 Tax=Romanomermis culicivorax TaxID=13658 RepID=A0A915ISE6_ROMCU
MLSAPTVLRILGPDVAQWALEFIPNRTVCTTPVDKILLDGEASWPAVDAIRHAVEEASRNLGPQQLLPHHPQQRGWEPKHWRQLRNSNWLPMPLENHWAPLTTLSTSPRHCHFHRQPSRRPRRLAFFEKSTRAEAFKRSTRAEARSSTSQERNPYRPTMMTWKNEAARR